MQFVIILSGDGNTQFFSGFKIKGSKIISQFKEDSAVIFNSIEEVTVAFKDVNNAIDFFVEVKEFNLGKTITP